MDSMREQMQALTQGIATAARERQVAVGDVKAQTARMLQAFGRERTVMAGALESDFAADREARMVNTGAIMTNTRAMRQAIRQDQARTRRDLRRTLAQSTEAVETFVASLRADIAKRCADVAKTRRHTARTQRTGLAKERRDRSRDVAELINNFRAARGEMAQELAESLAKSTQDVKFCVSGLTEWRSVALQKTHENASVHGVFPSYLLATQGSRESQAPFAVSSTAAFTASPEAGNKKKGHVKPKTAVARAVRAVAAKPGQPKTATAKAVRAVAGKQGKPKTAAVKAVRGVAGRPAKPKRK